MTPNPYLIWHGVYARCPFWRNPAISSGLGTGTGLCDPQWLGWFPAWDSNQGYGGESTESLSLDHQWTGKTLLTLPKDFFFFKYLHYQVTCKSACFCGEVRLVACEWIFLREAGLVSGLLLHNSDFNITQNNTQSETKSDLTLDLNFHQPLCWNQV